MATPADASSDVDADMPMKRLFVSEIDTLLGRRIIEKFGKTLEYRIVGTLRNDPTRAALTLAEAEAQQALPLPPWVSEIVPAYVTDNVEFKRQVLAADVIIVPMRDSTTEAAAAVRMLKNESYETEKTLVVVSSVLTWADTYVAQKAQEKAARDAERLAAIAAGEDVEDDEPAAGGEPEEVPSFSDDAYQRRVPAARFQDFKEVEHMAKAANSETLHTYVIFGGLQYGAGEDMLEPFFKRAWHLEPLPMHTDGNNFVPMIHVDDLATAVFKTGTYLDVLPQRYILGVDRGNVTWGAALKALNTALGCGQTYPEPRLGSLAFADWITIDIKLEGATINDLIEESEWVAPEGFVASIEKVAAEYKKMRGLTPLRAAVLGAPRAGKTTIAAAIADEYRVRRLGPSEIIREYTEYRDSLTQQISDHRKRRAREKRQAAKEEIKRAAREAEEERLRLEAEAAAAAADGEEGTGANAAAAEEGGAQQAAAEADVFEVSFELEAPPPRDDGAADGDGNGDGDAGDAPGNDGGNDASAGGGAPEVDPAANDDEDDEPLNKMKEELAQINKTLGLRRNGRFIDEALAVMGRRALTTAASRNQGYVLDGFPKTVRQAAALFNLTEIAFPEPDEDGNIPDEPLDASVAMAAVDGNLFLEHVIIVTCTEPTIIARAVDGNADSHNSLAGVYRRLARYRADNTKSTKPAESVESWFGAILTNDEGLPRAASVLAIDMTSAHAAVPQASPVSLARLADCRRFLGIPRFIHPTPEEILNAREAAQLRAEEERLAAIEREEIQHAEEQAKQAAADKIRRNDERRQRSVQEEREAAAYITSLAMNDYLAQFVIPALTDSISHVASLRPEDPVNSLADFLFTYTPKEKLPPNASRQ